MFSFIFLQATLSNIIVYFGRYGNINDYVRFFFQANLLSSVRGKKDTTHYYLSSKTFLYDYFLVFNQLHQETDTAEKLKEKIPWWKVKSCLQLP